MPEEKGSREPEIIGLEGGRVKVQQPSGAQGEVALKPGIKIPRGWTVQKVTEATVTFLDDQGRQVVRPKKRL